MPSSRIALSIHRSLLYVFWIQAGDVAERIMSSNIDLSKHWMKLKETEPVEVLRPERNWTCQRRDRHRLHAGGKLRVAPKIWWR
jgi:hypothetical protein